MGVVVLARRWTAHLDESLAEAGFSVGQLAVLTLLRRRPSGLTQREVADQLAVSETVISSRTAALLSSGLVERRPMIGDRRAHLLLITEAGERAFQAWSDCLSCVQERVTASISTEDLARVQKILSGMSDRLQTLTCQPVAIDAVATAQPDCRARSRPLP